jgi:aldose 1-epimerase
VVNRQPFGNVSGRAVEQITLRNSSGVEVRAITYGAIITAILAPDRDGAIADIVLGFDTLDGYLAGHPYFGAVVGRYCNRIAHGRFTIDGHDYRLAMNNGPHHLHGGIQGFDKQIWTAESNAENSITFAYVSVDGEEGYPGTLETAVTYTLTNRNELICEYRARTDKTTHVNLTQHSYFNLRGGGDVLDHQLTIDADRITEIDATLIPTGAIVGVEGTPFDFRRSTPIGARIDDAHPQVRIGHGYDHNWVLNRASDALTPAARLVEPTSGRTLDVMTTEPGMQVYTGNFLDGSLKGKSGRSYGRYGGVCLETQHYPDSPNQPDFPSTLIRPGHEYRSQTVFALGVLEENR